MGYVEETGVAQYLRDSRIAPINEGTNGIRAIDLVMRKVPMRGGGVVADLLAQMEALGPELAGIRPTLANGVGPLPRPPACSPRSPPAPDRSSRPTSAEQLPHSLSRVLEGCASFLGG
jgi:hypothetical protein